MATEAGFALKKKKRESAELDITPMIDITFLLLAFFVVVSKMNPQVPVALPLATYGESVPEKNCVMLIAVVSVNDPKEADIFKGRSREEGDRVQATAPIDQESEIAAFVEDQLSLRPQVQAILIKAEGDVKTGLIELIKRGIAGSELALTRQIYIAVEEQ